jgi:hypothetical protein
MCLLLVRVVAVPKIQNMIRIPQLKNYLRRLRDKWLNNNA